MGQDEGMREECLRSPIGLFRVGARLEFVITSIDNVANPAQSTEIFKIPEPAQRGQSGEGGRRLLFDEAST